MRTAGISYRDVAKAIKATRDFDISHAAIQRHEDANHFSVDAVLASATSVNVKDLSLKTIIDHKLGLYWRAHKDEVPDSTEIRHWFKLWAELKESEAAVEERQMLRNMFQPKIEVIEIKQLPETTE